MRPFLVILCLWGALLSVPLPLRALSGSGKTAFDGELPDTIREKILTNLVQNSGVVREYKADMYVRGMYRVHKRNELIRFVPSMFRFYKDVDEYLTEMLGVAHYAAPDVYHTKVRALTGTFRRNRAGLHNTLEFLQMNLYSPTLLPGRLVSPLDSIGFPYYHFRLDSVSHTRADGTLYHIRIVPRNKSLQLVEGCMTVRGGEWLISEIRLEGRIDLVDFSVRMQMGDEAGEVFLPKRFDIKLLFGFLGNRIETDYAAELTYRTVELRPPGEPVGVKERQGGYDLSAAYSLECETGEVSTDTALMAAARPFPLTARERQLYADYHARRRVQEETVPEPKRKSRVFFGELGDALISSYTINLSELGSVKCSPLINPFLMSYSHSNGFSYRQEFKYNRLFPNDRWLRLVPKVGYNFTRKELYWSTDFDFYYAPSRLGALTFRVGNGNRIYTSRVTDELRQLKDSLIDFSKLHLDYFNNMYVQVGNRIELTNGLQLMTGIAMHWRKAVRPSELVSPEGPDQGSLWLRPTYTTFAPRLRLTWTPGQYYYMNGRRKMNLYSRYPTFSFDYERGIRGILGSNGSHERLEADLQHRVSLSPMRHFFYRLGGGVFTNQHSVYFVDFANFTRNNLPTGWNDDIGGAFHLLDGEWYNASRWYSRAHFTYEAPFLLIPHLKKYTRAVDSERLYFSLLHTTHLHPYVEVGYGIGTHIFDFGLFVNNLNGKFGEVGCKFTFELFNR